MTIHRSCPKSTLGMGAFVLTVLAYGVLHVGCAAAKPAIYGGELAACELKPTGCEYVACCVKVAQANGRDPAQACALELCQASPQAQDAGE